MSSTDAADCRALTSTGSSSSSSSGSRIRAGKMAATCVISTAWSRPTVAVCRLFLLTSVLVLTGEFHVDLSAVSDGIYLHVGPVRALSAYQDTLSVCRRRSGALTCLHDTVQKRTEDVFVCGQRGASATSCFVCVFFCNAPCINLTSITATTTLRDNVTVSSLLMRNNCGTFVCSTVTNVSRSSFVLYIICSGGMIVPWGPSCGNNLDSPPPPR